MIVEEKEDLRLDDGDGDHDRFSHYVPKADIVRSNTQDSVAHKLSERASPAARARRLVSR